MMFNSLSRTAALRLARLQTTIRSFSSAPGNKNNFFEILNISTTFDVDDEQLKQSYRELMNRHHPDKALSASSLEDSQFASLVTRAYDVLKQPHQRACHLLKLLGKPMEETASGETLVGTDLLLNIMEIREQVDDCNCDDECLQKLLDENEQRQRECIEQLTKAFALYDLDQALMLTAQLQYWNRIHETIRERMNE
jgi:molecular chaperone HscB